MPAAVEILAPLLNDTLLTSITPVKCTRLDALLNVKLVLPAILPASENNIVVLAIAPRTNVLLSNDSATNVPLAAVHLFVEGT